jgi:hypothetical protein
MLVCKEWEERRTSFVTCHSTVISEIIAGKVQGWFHRGRVLQHSCRRFLSQGSHAFPLLPSSRSRFRPRRVSWSVNNEPLGLSREQQPKGRIQDGTSPAVMTGSRLCVWLSFSPVVSLDSPAVLNQIYISVALPFFAKKRIFSIFAGRFASGWICRNACPICSFAPLICRNACSICSFAHPICRNAPIK